MVVASTHLHVEIDRIEAGGKEREKVRASRIAGARQRTKGPPLAPRTRDASRTPLSLSPQHPPLVFEASENTMTRPPKSPPSVETGPLSSRAPPKRHPREKASRPLTIDERFRAERQKESARDRQCQGLNYSRPRRKDESRDPPSTGPPFVLPYTPHKHHTSRTLSLSPPYRRSPLDDDPTGTPFVRHPESFVQSIPTLSQMWPEPRGWAAIYVQDIDAPCVLRFAWIHALCCALHRSTSRVIHRPRS